MNKIIRVRNHRSGALGWYDTKSLAILADGEPTMRLMAYWQENCIEDQEDFGSPPEGYGTAYGWWVPVEST